MLDLLTAVKSAPKGHHPEFIGQNRNIKRYRFYNPQLASHSEGWYISNAAKFHHLMDNGAITMLAEINTNQVIPRSFKFATAINKVLLGQPSSLPEDATVSFKCFTQQAIDELTKLTDGKYEISLIEYTLAWKRPPNVKQWYLFKEKLTHFDPDKIISFRLGGGYHDE